MVVDINYKLTEHKCPCCGGGEIIDEFPANNCRADEKISARYARCASCGSLYVSPSMILDKKNEDYDERYLHTYDKLVKKLKRKWFRFLACRMFGLLTGFSHINLPLEAEAGDKLLDIGCGIGLQTKQLQKKGVQITGIDSSERAIKFALKINDGEEFICVDLFEMNNCEQFDFIRLDNVIEHIEKLSEFLDKIMTMLKPDGKLIVFTPNADSASLKLLRGKSVSAWPSEHVVIFSKEGLTDLLEKSGFEIKKICGNTPAWWLAYNFFMLIGVGNKITADSFLLKVISLFFLPLSYILNFLKLEEEIVVEAVCHN
jgi:2-polyprenyl-3-methyl-5-hydroxy-6-metoxy-1,4-benzoquinol methylase